MTEVLIHLNDIEYANQLKNFLEDKKEFAIWHITNQQTMVDLLEKDIIKDNSTRIVITDSDNKDMIDNINIPYDCYFIYVCNSLVFNTTKENETKILKTLNLDNFIICISMFKKTISIINGRNIIENNMYVEHLNLKNRLNPRLEQFYYISLGRLLLREYIVLQGQRLTGKTHLSKTLVNDNLYTLVNENTNNIEEIIFGDVYNPSKNSNIISIPNTYIIVDNFDKLSYNLQMRIVSAIKYRIYNKNNDNRQLNVKANFILTCTNETKAIKRLDNIMKLPDINDYSPTQKTRVILDALGIKNVKGITKTAIDYIDDYDYSYYGLEILYDIANYIKRNIGDDNNIKTEHLPKWLIEKEYNSYNNSELREIFDRGIFNLSDVEKLVVRGAFKKCLFKKEDTARLLGITVTTLNNKLRLYDIKAENLMEE